MVKRTPTVTWLNPCRGSDCAAAAHAPGGQDDDQFLAAACPTGLPFKLRPRLPPAGLSVHQNCSGSIHFKSVNMDTDAI